MIVVDASFLTDLFLNRPPAVAALDDLLDDGTHGQLHAPELIEPETLNALRRLLSGGHITEWQAGKALDDLAAVRLIRYPHAPLRDRVWGLRNELSAYDATYLALAEGIDGSVLATSDNGLALVARRHVGTARVRHTG